MVDESELGRQLQRGGETLPVRKVPDRFTVRMERGADPERIEGDVNVEHRRTMERPNLEVFSVDAPRLEEAMAEVRERDDTRFASHVYEIEGDPEAPIYLTDEITVRFAPEVEDSDIERITTDLGLELEGEVPGVSRAYVFRVTEQAKENPIKIAGRLLEHEGVVLSEPNVVVQAEKFYVPADPLFRDQWHLHHDGGPFLAAGSHVNAMRAWDLTRGERSVVVAVADDSCDLRHVDFQGLGKVVAPRDFYDRDFEPAPGLPDDNHGTACCGVAVAEENGRGVVGAAPGCALMPIRTTAMLDDRSIEELFAWVTDEGAAVVSCSWGPSARYFPLSLRQSNAIHRAATLGRGGLGCVIVFAAGNSNRPVNDTVDERGWPGDTPSGPTRWFDGFAAHPEVIAVSACTSLGKRSAYSNWGREISVCAPSNNARPRTFPRVADSAPGRGIVTTDRVGPSGYSSADHTSTFGGTSSACPLVAGVAALVLSANPGLRAAEVRAILERTADKIVDGDVDPQLGLSHGSYDAAGHSQWFGHGRVNAFAAVSAALAALDGDGPAAPVRKESAPGLAIPDDDPAGIRDTISFSESAQVGSVTVAVEITHPYVGDLRVALLAPSGRQAVLHDRRGGRRRDLKATFDADGVPALRTFAGERLRGDWTLAVQDLAARDVGRLESWRLEVQPRPGAVTELAEAPGLPIPDDDPGGIERTLAAADAGTVGDLEVDVAVTHPYKGDLRVELESPSGTVALLHDRSGGAEDNLYRSYAAATTPALDAIRGEAVAGDWTLRVADLAGRDLGKLDRWGVTIARVS